MKMINSPVQLLSLSAHSAVSPLLGTIFCLLSVHSFALFMRNSIFFMVGHPGDALFMFLLYNVPCNGRLYLNTFGGSGVGEIKVESIGERCQCLVSRGKRREQVLINTFILWWLHRLYLSYTRNLGDTELFSR